MKTRVVFGAIVGLAGFVVCSSPGALPPKIPMAENFDVRLQSPQAAANLLAPTAGQTAAVQQLRAVAGDIKVSDDKILGRPVQVSVARGFLTGPGGQGKAVSRSFLDAQPAGDSNRVVKAFLNEHPTLFHHDATVISSARVLRDEVGAHNGLHTTVWEQAVDGIPVFGARLAGNVTRSGELASVFSSFIPDPEKAATQGTPRRSSLVSNPGLTAQEALVRAAANISVTVEPAGLSVASQALGPEKKQVIVGQQLFGENHAELAWLPMNETSMRLCWRVILTLREPNARYLMLVDAESGEVLVRQNLTLHATAATYNVFTSDSPSPFSPGLSEPGTDQPDIVTRTEVRLAQLSANASPQGWVSEGSSPQTVGNNADAFLDRDYTGTPDTARPTAVNRVFDFPLNLTNPPTSYQSASTVQLFYDANLYHDRLYDMGFTEQAGNYQNNNFGRGGFDRDPIICLVQAGADVGISDNSVFFSAPDGISPYCAMFVFTGPTPQRDGALDQEVVFHELTHGLSTRLVGNGLGMSTLQAEGMGEGWSDFYALSLLSEADDDPAGNYAAGAYASFELGRGFQENYYYGIRRYPYSTDMSKNPLTFKDIDPVKADAHPGVPISPLFGGGDPSEVHNQGEVWCVTLWEVRANLVAKWGWEVGNDLALQLVTDAMKLSTANPTFVEGRDAIILADQIDTLGENYADLWVAFAKRGLGASAKAPQSDTTFGVEEAYDLPADVEPDGILEVRISPPSNEILFAGETNTILVRVSDTFGVTNATIDATTSTGEPLEFRNDGIAPDEAGSNAVYSASLIATTNISSITLRLVISAPDKNTVTNSVTYLVTVPPVNDDFAKAIKVPIAGAKYLTTNKRTTREPFEPAHAGLASAIRSVWWNYTPSSDTNILIDTAGSTFRTVVAVYTNNSLPTLQPVASAVGVSARPGAYVRMPVRGGVTYRIAIAGYDSVSVGLLNLSVLPGLVPDTNAPVVTVTSPIDGLTVATNRLLISGSAVDPSPNPSGVKSILVNVVSGLNGQQNKVEVPLSLLGPVSTNWNILVGLAVGENSVQVTAVDYAGNRSATMVTHVNYRPLDPANDFFVNATVIVTNSGVDSINTLNATKEVGEPNHGGSLGGKSAWWNFTPTTGGVLHLSTTNSTFDTVLGVYTGGAVGSLSPVASNDDAYDGAPGGYSEITCVVSSNQTYRIAVDGYDGLSGIVFLSYDFVPGAPFHVTVTTMAGGSVTPTSAEVASNSTVVLTATPAANYVFDEWEGGVVSLQNPLTLVVQSDMTVTARFRPVGITDDFESGDLQHIAWTTAGNKPWLVQTNVVGGGTFAAKSGSIRDAQSSSLLITGNFRSGRGSFDYSVSSEANFDMLKFFIDGIPIQQWSGILGWTSFPFDMMAGTHTLEWRYTKDQSGAAGSDAAFIDNVLLPFAVAVDASTPARLELKRQIDGSYFVNLAGQSNQRYVIQVSANLVDWSDLSTNIAVDGFIRMPISNVTTNQALFYRAVVAP